MTATILAFPSRKQNEERLAQVGESLRVATPLPSRDPELDLLLQIGGKLLDNLNDHVAVDCWLARLDQWEANRG